MIITFEGVPYDVDLMDDFTTTIALAVKYQVTTGGAVISRDKTASADVHGATITLRGDHTTIESLAVALITRSGVITITATSGEEIFGPAVDYSAQINAIMTTEPIVYPWVNVAESYVTIRVRAVGVVAYDSGIAPGLPVLRYQNNIERVAERRQSSFVSQFGTDYAVFTERSAAGNNIVKQRARFTTINDTIGAARIQNFLRANRDATYLLNTSECLKLFAGLTFSEIKFVGATFRKSSAVIWETTLDTLKV